MATGRDRQAVFDVACRTSDGERFIVEMQKREQAWFRERCLYYATFPIQEQAVKGKWDYSICPVYMVCVLDFPMEHRFPEGMPEAAGKKLIYRYSLREDDTGELMTDRLGFVFIEVGDFLKDEDELESRTDKWMFVLKNMARLLDRPAGLQQRIFLKLFEAAEIAAFSPEERKQYEHDMMTENDYWNTIEFARDKARKEGIEEGMQKGLDEGMQKGMDEGMKKGLVAAAAGMKKMGMETEAIAKATGLPRETIDRL